MNNDIHHSIFLSEKLMKVCSIIPVIGGLLSIIILSVYKDMTLMTLFEKVVKLGLTFLLFWAFTRYKWDFLKGIMGGILFCLMYEESFWLLGTLWANSAIMNNYLIMGVQGSLFFAAENMRFIMIIIITLNHFIINYGNKSNWRNIVFNQIAILFTFCLYFFLLIVNMFLYLPRHTQINSAIEYIIDICIIITLICIEAQLEDFRILRMELMSSKKGGMQA